MMISRTSKKLYNPAPINIRIGIQYSIRTSQGREEVSTEDEDIMRVLDYQRPRRGTTTAVKRGIIKSRVQVERCWCDRIWLVVWLQG